MQSCTWESQGGGGGKRLKTQNTSPARGQRREVEWAGLSLDKKQDTQMKPKSEQSNTNEDTKNTRITTRRETQRREKKFKESERDERKQWKRKKRSERDRERENEG